MIRICGVVRESIVDGPGLRFVLFTQGCPHHCPGCHNPESHAMDGGYEVSSEKVLEEFRKNPLLKGITLSGGDPIVQAEELVDLCHSDIQFHIQRLPLRFPSHKVPMPDKKKEARQTAPSSFQTVQPPCFPSA